MKKVYAVWEGERTRDYITPGKKYEVLPSKFFDFDIIDDDGDMVACSWKNCVRLDYQDWTRIEEDGEAPKAAQKTLRDEFAMATLTGLLASGVTGSAENFSENCYKMADAMLEARKK